MDGNVVGSSSYRVVLLRLDGGGSKIGTVVELMIGLIVAEGRSKILVEAFSKAFELSLARIVDATVLTSNAVPLVSSLLSS